MPIILQFDFQRIFYDATLQCSLSILEFPHHSTNSPADNRYQTSALTLVPASNAAERTKSAGHLLVKLRSHVLVNSVSDTHYTSRTIWDIASVRIVAKATHSEIHR